MKPKSKKTASTHTSNRSNGKKKTKTRKQTNGHSAADLSDIWLDKEDVMLLMHISPRTLYKWHTLGGLPYSRIFGKIYYSKKDLMNLLARNRKTNA